MIANKYSVIEKISEGSFGTILKGKNERTGELVAIKIESKTTLTPTLKTEAKIYQYLGKQDGFPQLKWFGTNEKYNYLVVDLFGHSLTHSLTHDPINCITAIEFGIQIITRIETLHSKSLLHRDIKPDNFLFGLRDETNKLYLIDFGFCKRYEYNGRHIQQKSISSIVGSLNFVSLNIHNGLEPSRRDDIESCIYIILYMYTGYLEWIKFDISREKMIKLKRELTNNPDIPFFISHLLQYIRLLDFDEIPDYKYIISKLAL
jgi:serine/threonine protein kinase